MPPQLRCVTIQTIFCPQETKRVNKTSPVVGSQKCTHFHTLQNKAIKRIFLETAVREGHDFKCRLTLLHCFLSVSSIMLVVCFA